MSIGPPSCLTRTVPEDLGALCLGTGATAAEAIQRLRQHNAALVVVVDKHNCVRGTVTDDNIRRWVIAGTSTDSRLGDVLTGRALTATPAMAESDLLELLVAHRLRSIAVVDDGRLVDIVSLTGHPVGLRPATAVIMAGGRGLRLRPLTDKVPKPLLKIGPTSIVERIISSLAAAGVREVYLAVNYMAELFEQRLGTGSHLGVALKYLKEEQEMGTAGALSLLPDEVEGPILVTNGDIVTTVDFGRLLDFHWHHASAVTVAAAPYLVHIPYGVVRTVEHHLLSIEEKPARREYCSAGIYVLEPHVLRLLQPKTSCDMPDLIGTVLADGLPVSVFPILEKWYDIGGPAEFERVLVQFATGDEEWHG